MSETDPPRAYSPTSIEAMLQSIQQSIQAMNSRIEAMEGRISRIDVRTQPNVSQIPSVNRVNPIVSGGMHGDPPIMVSRAFHHEEGSTSYGPHVPHES